MITGGALLGNALAHGITSAYQAASNAFNDFRASSSNATIAGVDAVAGSGNAKYSSYAEKFLDNAKEKAEELGILGDEEPSYPYDWGNSASGSSPSTPQQLQYIDAPYAEMYGMDASTAYQEALANTAYQRKVKDLKAAGLNPVLGYSGAGAASFYGTPDAGFSSSGSGGVSYGSSGSGKTTKGLTDNQRDTLIRNIPTIIGSLVSIKHGPAVGNTTTAVGNAIGNIIRYW